MQSDARLHMGINKLEESISIDLTEKGKTRLDKAGGSVGGDTSACGVGTGICSYYLLSVNESSY
jgi:hypothetical protein